MMGMGGVRLLVVGLVIVVCGVCGCKKERPAELPVAVTAGGPHERLLDHIAGPAPIAFGFARRGTLADLEAVAKMLAPQLAPFGVPPCAYNAFSKIEAF